MKKWFKKLSPYHVLLAFFLMLNAFSAQASEIKIGVILAETGPAALLGGPGIKSLQMLTESLNAAGGIRGNTIELVFKDSGGSPEKAISFAKQLIEEEKVFAIIGPSTSGETLKIKELCEKAGTMLISCASAELIVNPLARYVFKRPRTIAWPPARSTKQCKARASAKSPFSPEMTVLAMPARPS